jgi:TetR/AcrR family transcriptional regulator, transcriptional repressor for nem operon
MRRSREETAATRARIVAVASRLFRARGIDATSVADVMSALGLTVGGFYRHFDSKEALVTEAIDAASRETTDRHLTKPGPREGREGVELLSLLDRYLSDSHRQHTGQGCPVAALCSEVGHASKETKKAFTGAVHRLLTTVDSAMGHDPGSDREGVLFAASAAVGAIALARATHDESLAGELLSAVRKRLLETYEKVPVRRRLSRPAESG